MTLEQTLLFCELMWGREIVQDVLSCCQTLTMQPYISMITLGVSDLERSTQFYRDGLGFPTQGDFEGVTFFRLRGAWLSLFPRDELNRDANAATAPGVGGFTLAHNVKDKAEVEAVLEVAQRAGARILKPAQDAFWGGYHGFFADPDGFVWEIAWNPYLDLS